MITKQLVTIDTKILSLAERDARSCSVQPPSLPPLTFRESGRIEPTSIDLLRLLYRLSITREGVPNAGVIQNG